MSHTKELTKGIFKENPVFIIMLGMCPTLGVTTQVFNAIGMGAGVIFVLLCSNIIISLLRKVIPDSIRIPSYIVIIASLVTIVQMVVQAYMPELYSALGAFLSLIVVNCIILARAESFAFKHTPVASAVDGIGMGLGFTIALTLLGAVRELLGAGSIFGLSLFGASYQPALLFILPPGAFLTLGFLMALFNKVVKKKVSKEKA